MTPMKSLMRPYSSASWLLAVGLALGWASEAAAFISLTPGGYKVHEDAGKTTITLTATNLDNDSGEKTKVAENTAVVLELSPGTTGTSFTRLPPGQDYRERTDDWKDWYGSRIYLNSRFYITLPTIVIPKGKEEATGTISFTPIDNGERGFYDTYDDFTVPTEVRNRILDRYPDLVIEIDGNTGERIQPTIAVRVIDDEKLSSRLDFSFSPTSLSKDAGPTPVTVTATLNGGTLRSDQTFTLVFANVEGVDPDDFPFGVSASDILTRDTDYSATAASLTLRRNQTSVKTTITIDPKGKAGRIVLKAAQVVIQGVDFNLDGDRADSFALITHSSGSGISLTEEALGCIPTTSGTPSQHDVNFDGNCGGLIREARVGIDLNADEAITPSTEHEFWLAMMPLNCLKANCNN